MTTRELLERTVNTLDSVWAAIGDRLLAEGPLSQEYASHVTADVTNLAAEIRAALAEPEVYDHCARCGAQNCLPVCAKCAMEIDHELDRLKERENANPSTNFKRPSAVARVDQIRRK